MSIPDSMIDFVCPVFQEVAVRCRPRDRFCELQLLSLRQRILITYDVVPHDVHTRQLLPQAHL